MSRHRVILVREWDSQHTGSGCCGTLGGHDAEVGGGDWAHARTLMEGVGAVYRTLREQLADQDVDVEVADPRNTFWLLPAIWRDARRAGATRGEAWRAVRDGTTNGAVIADGQVVATGPVLIPASVLARVTDRLGVVGPAGR